MDVRSDAMGFHTHRCPRAVWRLRPKDGYCWQHHPDTIKDREAARNAKNEKLWNRVLHQERIRKAQNAVLQAADAYYEAWMTKFGVIGGTVSEAKLLQKVQRLHKVLK